MARRTVAILSMCVFVALIWVPITAQATGENKEFVPVYHPQLTIKRSAGAITIDGHLEDPGWKGAARAGNFAEHSPGDQTKPEVDTEVFITYDDDHLYVGWICYDDPNEVRASFCERDQIFSDDFVMLLLDLFGEATLAYEIAVNPYGIPGDLLFSSSNGEDSSYDIIYESSGRLTEFGWVAEMAIPFRSLRFPKAETQTWRVDFWRNRPRESRFQYSWSAYDRDENCWPCQWGTVTGATGVKPGKGLDLLPALIGSQSGSLDDDNRFKNDDFEGDASLGIAYKFSSELTAEATINPDFSQVESDVAQIDVNSTFALFYPERRPFFQEGSDLFDTYFNAVYTRSINDPILAGKATWRKGASSVAFLTARDEHTVLILPFEESSEFIENGESYSNILRAKYDLGEQSHMGVVATDRRFDDGGSNTVGGVDGRIRFMKNNTFLFQLLGTHTEEMNNLSLADSAFNEETFDDGKYTKGLDGEEFYGHAIFANLSRDTRNYWFGAEYFDRSPTFRADNGFEPGNSIRMGDAYIGGIKRFENSTIMESIDSRLDGGMKYNYKGIKKDEWANIQLQLRFRAAQTSMHARYLRSNELFGGIQFNNIWGIHNCLQSSPSKMITFGGHIDYGHRIARYDLVMGKETNTGVWTDLRPIDRILLSSSFNYITSDDLKTDENLFSQSVFRTRFNLQVTRELSARLIVQYNDRYDKWDVDPLITYRINPFSIFYIGSTHNYTNSTLAEDGREGWTLTDRQFFLKLQYLFQI